MCYTGRKSKIGRYKHVRRNKETGNDGRFHGGNQRIFLNFRDDDMLIWDKLVQMQEDKTEFEVTVEGIVKGGVIAYVEGIRAFIRFPSWLCTM